MLIYKDCDNNYYDFFNEKNGFLLRTNILDSNGKQTNRIPLKRNFPDLIDIGIMGKCHVDNIFCRKMGIGCYQGNVDHEDMSLDNYKIIIDQIKGKTFQVALGGKGDPNKHKNFEQILEYTRKNGIVPNLTTSGYGITTKEIDLIKKYCGAVAVSFYSKINRDNRKESNSYTLNAIKELTYKEVKTNIHYVISNNTIDDAIYRLKYGLFPKNINAIVFLLCKDVGYTKSSDLIDIKSEKFQVFLELIEKNKYNYQFGFDSCFSPIIIDKINILKNSVNYCEAARFSCYISPNMVMYPCSFVQNEEYGISLLKGNIKEIWKSNKFHNFIKLSNQNFVGECAKKLNNL